MKIKPKNKRALASVKRLGRNYSTGNFKKIANAVAKKTGSKEAGAKVAGSIYWKKVKARKK